MNRRQTLKTASSSPASDELGLVYKKINWRLLPFLLLCYFFAYLDRINIGFAKLQMQQDIGISDAVYGFAAGIFFLGYVLFEVPSNLMLPKIGARKTISRIMILWGLTSAGMLFVRDATTFYILRFMLGVFEAGFAPGMIFYMTYWYPPSRRAGALAILWLTGPLGGMIGGPLSTWLMTSFAGAHGLAGWQWMFLIEGLPSVVMGVTAFYYLSDKPSDAKWLSPREKALLAANLSQPQTQHSSFRNVLKDGRVYAMALTYFCVISGIYTVSFWLPTILKEAGVTNTMEIGMYSAVPYVTAAIFMIVAARSSDRHRERRLHTAVPAILGALALWLATVTTGNLALSLLSISLATAFMWTSYSVFWAMPSDYLKGDAAAGGIALINSIGLLGGFVSPSIIGWAKTATGSMSAGLFVMVGLLILGGGVMVLNRLPAPSAAKLTV
jgi:D-galactonate transporter